RATRATSRIARNRFEYWGGHHMLKVLAVTLLVGSSVVPGIALGANSPAAPMVVAQATSAPKANPKEMDAAIVTIRATVEAVDAEKKAVTLKGPKRSLTLHLRDPKKLEMIKVGDPVMAKYYEALVIEVKKPGEATPGVTMQQAVATSKPGETPAGIVG